MIMKLKNLYIKMAERADFGALLSVGRVDILCRKNKAYLGGFINKHFERYDVDYDWPNYIEANCPIIVEYRSKISDVVWYVAVQIEEVINSHGDVYITVKKLGDVVTAHAAA